MKTAAYMEIRAPRWGVEEKEVQIVAPKKPWVFGTGRGNALIHKINHIRLRWWDFGPGGHYLVRLQSPRIAAVCNCGRYIRLTDTSGRMCAVPKADAVICKACMGEGRNFPRGREHEISASLARVRLGCIEVPA